MKRSGRHAVPLVALVALAPACASKPAPKEPAPAVSPSQTPAPVVPTEVSADAQRAQPAEAPTKSADEARAALAPFRVGNDRVARSILFTWTTAEQAQELKTNKVLLSRTESPTKGASYYDRVLIERARDPKNKLAQLLRSPGFAKARFAWPSPWPTRLGWPNETYGDVLIGVKLKPEALFVKMRTATLEWEVVDIEDKPVPVARALAQPGRIAAIYFVNDAIVTTRPGDVPERWAFREYVLCNEAMVADWSMGTAREHNAIAESKMAIDTFSKSALPEITEDALAWNARVAKAWATEPAVDADPVDMYMSALSAPNQLYWPVKQELEGIVRALGTAVTVATMSHAPNARFVKGQADLPQPKPGAQPKPVARPKRPPMGTF